MKSRSFVNNQINAMVAAAKRCEQAAAVPKLPDTRAVGEASTFLGLLKEAIEGGRLFTPERVAIIAPILWEIALEAEQQFKADKQRIAELTERFDRTNNTNFVTEPMVRNLLGYL
jgi:hypothetical protein